MTGLNASGRFVLRLRPPLHRSLRRLAARRKTSLNSLCAEFLDEAVQADSRADACLGNSGGRWLQLAREYAEASDVDVLGVALFGSAVRGELRADSDIDLLLVVGPAVALRRTLYRRWDEFMAAREFEREVNAHFVQLPNDVEDTGSLWLEVAVEGRLLADTTGEIGRYLVALRRAIAEGRFVRRTAHGQPYWRHAT